MVKKDFFKQDTICVAKKLLGKVLVKGKCKGIIVETEAYKDDPASHARKRTPRSEIMFNSYGKVYVYFVYGNHYCLNFTCEDGKPGAVLIRAVEPIAGIELMKKRRKVDDVKNLCNGPGKLCQAFNITKKDNGTDVGDKIKVENGIKPKEIVATPRIGIKQGKELLWRFIIKGNDFVSKRI